MYKLHALNKKGQHKLPFFVNSWFTGADLCAGEVAAHSELDIVVIGV